MSIHLKTLNWRQAKIIDTATAKKIIDFEEERTRKMHEIVFDLMGFPVLLISFFLLWIDMTYRFSNEMGYIMDIFTMGVFVFGFFFSIIRKFKVNKHALGRVAYGFIAIWLMAGICMLIDFKLSFFEIIYVWSAVIIFGILIAKRDYMTLIAVNGVYFAVAYLLDRMNPRILNLDEHHWMIISIALVSPTIFVGSGIVTLFKKIFPFIKGVAKSTIVLLIVGAFARLKKQTRSFLEWFETWRLAILAVLIGILLSTVLRGRDSFLDQTLWSNDKLYLISFTGFMILLGSMLVKEKSMFSVFFSLIAWTEIIFRLFLVTPQGPKFTLAHFRYEPGMFAIALLLVYGAKFIAKKFTNPDLPSHEITLLGPIGTFTTVILISFR